MAIGIAVANAILLVTSAETVRREGSYGNRVGGRAAANRLRPILMTSLAMIAGMIPMALGLGESGRQTAPLAIAVIGGLLVSVVVSLWLLPLVYDAMIGRQGKGLVSLDPNDKNSQYYDENK